MSNDSHLNQAIEQVRALLGGERAAPIVKGFFHEPTFTASYVVHDPTTKVAAIVDSVLDFDQPSGRTCARARGPRCAAGRRSPGSAPPPGARPVPPRRSA